MSPHGGEALMNYFLKTVKPESRTDICYPGSD